MKGLLTRIKNWMFSTSRLPYECVLALDCIIVCLSGILGQYLAWGGSYFVAHFWPMVTGVVVVLVIYVVFFRLLHTYSGIVRYSTFVDLQRVITASIFASLVSLIIGMLLRSTPKNVIFMPSIAAICVTFGAATLLMCLMRILVKSLFDNFRIESAKPVAIYGTKAGGISLANSIQSVSDKQYRLCAFISDGSEMEGSIIMGKRVFMNGPGIGGILKNMGIKVLLVSPLKTRRFCQNQEMVEDMIGNDIKIMIMSPEVEWDGHSELTHNQLHEIQIEDLLPRDAIEINMGGIAEQLQGKRILITGAAGSIGSEMVRQVAVFHPAEMVLIDQAETPMHDIRLMMQNEFAFIKSQTIVASITDASYMESVFREHKPDYVFHAAAYKHVPMMEDNPVIAVRNNIYGTRVIADLAVKYHTRKFVMISTDKAVNPTNVMGCSKRICEIYCQSLNKAIADGTCNIETFDGKQPVTQFVTTRFGNVLGSNGSVIPLFRQQIEHGGPVTVTHPDIIRYFMIIPEACKLVLEAGTMGHGGEIFVFDMGTPVRIADLARRMIRLSGNDGIKIVYTGLREGEKLYEEVLSDKENTIPTKHPKIMVATVREYDYVTACMNDDRLLEACNTMDPMQVVRVMKEIVPEYKSNVSRYEVLDK